MYQETMNIQNKIKRIAEDLLSLMTCFRVIPCLNGNNPVAFEY